MTKDSWSAERYNSNASFVYSAAYTSPTLELLAAKPGVSVRSTLLRPGRVLICPSDSPKPTGTDPRRRLRFGRVDARCARSRRSTGRVCPRPRRLSRPPLPRARQCQRPRPGAQLIALCARCQTARRLCRAGRARPRYVRRAGNVRRGVLERRAALDEARSRSGRPRGLARSQAWRAFCRRGECYRRLRGAG